MVIFNLVGVGMIAVSWAIALGVVYLMGSGSEGVAMMIAGPMSMLSDAVYRLKHPTGHWFHPNGGGSLFFLPVWLFGLLWLTIGAFYTFAGLTPRDLELSGLGEKILGGIGLAIIALGIWYRLQQKKPPQAESASSSRSETMNRRARRQGDLDSGPSTVRLADKTLCYVCGEPLAQDELASRVCHQCRA
jgi:hypothetical protein